MQKLTRRYKKWLLNRSAREERKRSTRTHRCRKGLGSSEAHLVSAWLGGDTEQIVAENLPEIPPARLSIRRNSIETLEFIGSTRDRLNIRDAYENPGKFSWLKRAKSKKGLKRITSYVDFSKIEEISTAAALVLTAEYHRASRFMGSLPPVINLAEWSDGVFWPMYQIGFFEAIGKLSEEGLQRKNIHGVEYLPAFSGTSGSDLEAISANVRKLIEGFSDIEMDRATRVELNSAIGEAIVNVPKWAYPSDHSFDIPHLSNFWVTASFDPLTRNFTLAVYDQGVSIPISYPKKQLSDRAKSFLSDLIFGEPEFEHRDDGAYIACAMEFGSSSSGVAHRGKGLPQMKDLIDHADNGSLMVCSRGGLWQYERGKQPRYQSFRHSIGGTLIEWTICLANENRKTHG